MADETLPNEGQETPDEKLSTYQSILEINIGFSSVLGALHELENAEHLQTEFLRPKEINEFSGLVRELQAEINHSLLNALQQIEAEDAFRFGKVRIERGQR